MCTHTLHYQRLTVNLTTQGAALALWAHPDFSKSCLSELIIFFFFMCSCYHCSCEVVMQFFCVFLRSATHNSLGTVNLTSLS